MIKMIKVNNDLGYTKDMKTITASKVLSTLEKMVRFDGNVGSRICFILTRIVLEGFVPKMEKNYSYYSGKIDGYTKPKTRYTIECDNEKFTSFNEITKTEFDFANWLVDSGITTLDAVEKFEKIENDRVLAIEDENNRIVEEEKARIEFNKKESEKFSAWLNEETQKTIALGDDRVDTLRDLFMCEIGIYSEFHASILVLIDNMNDDRCKMALKDRLHTGNKASKKAFYHMTGIKLPTTDKGTKEVLNSITMDDIKNTIPYVCKATTKSCKEDVKDEGELFYIKTRKGDDDARYEGVKGYRLNNKHGLELFYHKTEDGYRISHIATGICLCGDVSNKKDLTKTVYKIVDAHGIEKLKDIMNNAIKTHGTVPNYNTIVEEVAISEEVVVEDAKDDVKDDVVTTTEYSNVEIRDIANNYKEFLVRLKSEYHMVDRIDDYIADLETTLIELNDSYRLRENDDELRYKQSFREHIAKYEKSFRDDMKYLNECKQAHVGDDKPSPTKDDYLYSITNIKNVLSHIGNMKSFKDDSTRCVMQGSLGTQQECHYNITRKGKLYHVTSMIKIYDTDDVIKFDRFDEFWCVIRAYIEFLSEYQLDYKKYLDIIKVVKGVWADDNIRFDIDDTINYHNVYSLFDSVSVESSENYTNLLEEFKILYRQRFTDEGISDYIYDVLKTLLVSDGAFVIPF